MSDKIESNDIFQSGFEDPIIASFKKIVDSINVMQNQLKENIKTNRDFANSFKVNNSDDIKKLTDAINKLSSDTSKYKTVQDSVKKAEIEQQKLLQEKEKLTQLQIRTAKLRNSNIEKELTLYQKQSKTLNELRNAYKDVALAQGLNSKAAKDLLAQITPLDAKLKKIDASVGQFQRNVGNYASALNNFKSSVTNILGAAGIGLGLSEGFNFLKESLAEFTKSEKVVKDLGFALKNLTGEGGAALEKLNAQAESLEETFGLFESEDISILQKQLVQLGLNSADVEKLTPKIIDLAAATGKDLGEATDIAIKAINGQTKGLKEVGLNFTDTGNRLDNYNILLDKLDKFQGSAANSADTLQGKQTRLAIAWGNIKEAIGSYLVTAGDSLLDSFDLLTGKISGIDVALKQMQQTFNDNAKQILASGGANEALIRLQAQATAINNLAEQGTITQVERVEKLKVISAQQKALIKEINDQIDSQKKVQSFAENNVIKEDKDRAEKVIDDTERLIKQTEDLKAQGLIDEKARLEEIARLDFERKVKDVEDAKASEEVKTEAIIAITEEYFGKLGDIEDKFLKEQQDKRKKQREEEEKAFNDAVALAQKLSDEEEKIINKEYEERKKKREQEYKDRIDFAQKTLDLAEKALKKENEMREKALEEEISRREDAVDFQRERALGGLNNTLAFEEQKLAEAELRKQELAEKQLKREKALAFFKLLAANAESDPKNALAKTLGETILAESIAGGLSGKFFEGTEKVEDDLKGNKAHSGRDGYYIAVDGKERIFTGKQNEKIGNIDNETAANVLEAYNKGRLLPNYAIDSGSLNKSSASDMYNSLQLNQLVQLNDGINQLNKTIKNKPETKILLDKHGNVFSEVKTNGITQITKMNGGKSII